MLRPEKISLLSYHLILVVFETVEIRGKMACRLSKNHLRSRNPKCPQATQNRQRSTNQHNHHPKQHQR